MPVIGFLSSTSPDLHPWLQAAFQKGLGETGYAKGQNVAIEYRSADGHFERLPALAADLVNRRVDLIATGGTPGAPAAKSATSTIPIVFSVGDPVEKGEGVRLLRLCQTSALEFAHLAVVVEHECRRWRAVI